MSDHTPTLLIADDEADFRAVLQEMLAPLGVTVTTAGSGTEALDLLRARRFDAMISDIAMPGLDGLALLAHARDMGLELPVVFLTAHFDRQRVLEALRLDAFDFHEKPVDWDGFVASVRLALAIGGRMRTLEAELDALCAGNAVAPDRMAAFRTMQRELLKMKKQRAALLAAKAEARRAG